MENGPLKSENGPLRRGNAPLTLRGCFRANGPSKKAHSEAHDSLNFYLIYYYLTWWTFRPRKRIFSLPLPNLLQISPGPIGLSRPGEPPPPVLGFSIKNRTPPPSRPAPHTPPPEQKNIKNIRYVHHWEVLNGVGVDGVGGIFPFSSFFFAFLLFSHRTRGNDCNISCSPVALWKGALVPNQGLYRPALKGDNPDWNFLRFTAKIGGFLRRSALSQVLCYPGPELSALRHRNRNR